MTKLEQTMMLTYFSLTRNLRRATLGLVALLLTLLIPTQKAQADGIALNDDLLNLSASVATPANAAQPFALTLEQSGAAVTASFTMAPGAYIYQDSIKFSAEHALFSLDPLPPSTSYQDLQGSHEVYFDKLNLRFKLERIEEGASISLSYQGCSADGICYPPVTQTLSLDVAAAQAALNDTPLSYASDTAFATANATPQTTDGKISSLLSDSFLLGLLFCIGFGILLDLTPCVLPMLPIVSAMAAGGSNKSKGQVIVQNLSYSLGLCCTYTLLGLLFAAAGASLQGILQHPIFLLALSLLLVVCALGTVDIIKLQLPQALNAKLQNTASHYTKGSLASAFILGIVSALIASPCTSAPLAGALLYVLKSGDLIKGALAFFAIGVGMSLPLFFIGVFGSRVLKKAGRFSQMIKRALASLLVIAALYLCRNLMPVDIYLYALSSLIFAAIIYIGYERILDREKNVQFFPAVLLFAGAYFISEAVYTINGSPSPNVPHIEQSKVFTKLNSLEELNNTYADKKIFLDFTAAWCTNCQVMEKSVFNTQDFAAWTNDYVRLQFDITDTNDPKVKAMLEHFKIFGVPYFVVLENGEITNAATGIMSLKQMRQFLGK